MSHLTPPRVEEPEVSGSVRLTSVARESPPKNWSQFFTSRPKHSSPPVRLSALHLQRVRKCFFARPMTTKVASIGRPTPPAHCQSAAASSPATFPPLPSTASGMQNFRPTTATASGDDVINVSELYSRLMLNCGLRVAGAMAVTAVPAFFFFKRPFVRAFLIGSAGGLVSGWQLYKADLIIRNPRENAALVPKSASLAECADEIQREWAETVKRFIRVNWKDRA